MTAINAPSRNFTKLLVVNLAFLKIPARPIAPNAMGEELKYTHINKGLKTQGSLCFQVPTDAREVVIKVGDYIEIKVR